MKNAHSARHLRINMSLLAYNIKTTLALIIVLSLLSCETGGNKNAPFVKEGMINVKGGRIWYKIVGADKKGIPLLVVHGGPGIPHDYLEPLEALSDERPVIFYDQLGCGKSDKPVDTTLWTVERFVDELATLINVLKFDKIHILGQSWGTMLAVEYMIMKKPGNIVSLILSAPFLDAPRWIQDQRQWISELPKGVQDTIAKYEASGDYSSAAYQEALMIFYNKHVCLMDPWPECMTHALENINPAVYEFMAGPSEFTFTGTLKDVQLSNELYKIECPVLYTCGEFDEAKPTTTAFYQSKTPGSEIVVFKNASHAHHLEKTKEYLKVSRDFLKSSEKIKR